MIWAASTTAVATPWWVAPAVIAALIAAGGALITLAVQGRRSARDRQRLLVAEAFAAAMEYCEYPYIVRRRTDNSEDRLRITDALSDVQRRLNQYEALLLVEAPRLGRAYEALVAQVRGVAGPAITAGWQQPPRSVASDMPVSDVDLTAISATKQQFLTVSRDHFTLAPWWLRAALRRLRR